MVSTFTLSRLSSPSFRKTTPIAGCSWPSARPEGCFVNARRRVQSGEFEVPPIPGLITGSAGLQAALAATLTEIGEISDPDVRDALKIALSSIVVRVSNYNSDTRYAAVKKSVSAEDVWGGFERAASSLGSALTDGAARLFDRRGEVRVINKDLMCARPEDIGREVGLVITSPPYPNRHTNTGCTTSTACTGSAWILALPSANEKSAARPYLLHFKKDHQTEVDFERQMSRCFSLLSRVMRPGTYACFVVGRSVIHGRKIDNEALLERAAAPHGFRKVGTAQRNIAVHRKSFNLAHGTINREAILVFVLEGT